MDSIGVLGIAGSVASIIGIPLAIYFGVLPWLAERRKVKAVNADLAGRGVERLVARRKVVGRDQSVRDLRELLLEKGGSAITPVAQGIGGAGKTTLAQKYAQVYSAKYAKQRMLRAETEQTLIASLASFGRDMSRDLVRLDDIAAAKLTLEIIEDRSAEAPWLLIYDNAEKPEILERWRARGQHCHVLVTSRFPDWEEDGFTIFQLPKLMRAASVELLRQEADRDDPGFPELAETLGDLPLALVQAGEWLRANKRASAKDYEADIKTLRTRLPRRDRETEADRTSAAVVEKTLGLLTRDARAVLDILAWWAPEGLEPRLFTDVDPRKLGRSRAWHLLWRILFMLFEPESIENAFQELRLRALLEQDEVGGTYRLHRVFSTVVREQVRQRGRARFRKARAAAVLLEVAYPGGARSPQNPDTWAECRFLTPHAMALWSKAVADWRGAWGQPAWEAMDALLNWCGLFFASQENRAEEIAAMRGSLEINVASYDETEREIPLALGSLGMTLSEIGDFEEAEKLLDRAVVLDGRDRPGSEDHVVRLTQRAVLEFKRHRAGASGPGADLAKADDRLQTARGFAEDPARRHSDALKANVANDIGFLRGLQGRRAEAAKAYERALALTPPGASNRAYRATRAINIGATWLEAGAPERAEPLLREANGICAEIFAEAPGHSLLQNAAGWLADCLLVLDRRDGTRQREAEARELNAVTRSDWSARVKGANTLPLTPEEAAARPD
ncbi:MAG: tetratricopeptide repeat protein [Pseudomonadota bacterium]